MEAEEGGGDNYQVGKCSKKISHQPPFDGI